MRFNTIVLALITTCALTVIPLYAQVQSVEDIETPTPQFQDHGGVTPWFWIGVQTVFGAGYNIETTAGGFRNYGGDNHTYASFNLAFVDSHYQTPKFYEVPREIDPDAWTGHFTMLNFTTRANSWEGGTKSAGWENNAPAWLAEITGKGAHIGFFSQAGNLIGGITDSNRTEENNSKPVSMISGGSKVLNLRENQLGQLYYEKDTDDLTTTKFTNGSAIMYAGYAKQELFNVYLTMLSQGNVNSNVGPDKDQNKGFAGVIDFGVSPFGLITDDENPLTFNITGNVITGFNWKGDNTNARNNAGFGLKAEAGVWLMDNFVLAPVVAFDGKSFKQKFNDEYTDRFNYKIGGGLTFQFSGMRWVNDEWGDLYYMGGRSSGTAYAFADYRYENNKILKYAYAQVYGAFSETYAYNALALPSDTTKDFNLMFRVEEPDGAVGFHDKLGAMLEMRLYNLTKKNDTDVKWETQGRVSWDINIKQYLVTPYIRGYLNDDTVFKLRLGAYANLIPFTGFELAYTSANLNKNVNLPRPSYLNASYEKFFDAGRIELLVILKSDEIRPTVPKRMSDWNYPDTIQNY